MRVERVSSAIRLELRPGEWVLWQARPFRFISLHGSAARIRDTVTAQLREVPVADLRGMPTSARNRRWKRRTAKSCIDVSNLRCRLQRETAF